ncbi:TIGR03982 family His-Xaa-Ser system protein [Erythrobacter sp. THAF29]|uniref:TIGR03982 family His-Xaa-Ser system protein n=1 Tax=Erythrobacter sp. THAF29 TaxID=2587851 RepID=UPI0012689ACA|nr:TIGR03982 family His-Xaa-Ser system protein [Erythrobacter sp. THAF29]
MLSHGLAALIGAGIAWTAMPLWREAVMAWHQDEYGILVEQCDTAMRDHFQAKQAIAVDQSEENETGLAAGEMGLIVCQDYDLYQKRLLQWGLREEELSQMRLQAIEARATDLQEVIDTHEIRF